MAESLAILGAALLSQKLSAQDVVGTAMIGTGNRGSYVLKKILSEPGAKVVALCDLKPDRLDQAASIAARDRPATYKDYRQLLERKDIDAVFIDTPCHLHVEMAIAALEAGKHVYCEKPVGITPESIARLVKVVKSTNRVFCAGQQMRSFTWIKTAVAKIHEGIAGDVIMIKAQRHSGSDLDHDGPSADWFFDRSRSGDVIVEMAVHNLDVCNWVIGDHPQRAAGFGGTLLWKNDPPGRTNMDGYTLSYDYANGPKASFTQVFFHPSGMPGGGQYFYVYGTKGAVDLNAGKFYPLKKGAQPVVLVEPEKEENDQAHVSAFYKAIRSNTAPPADIQIGASAALTAIMGREAIYGKKVVSWADMGVQI